MDVKPRPEVAEDLRQLESNALRLEALRLMLRLRDEPRLGIPLGKRAITGDLSDCRKLYFDEARHRIVYRLVPDESTPTHVDVIVVGPRAAVSAYAEAVKRLGRAV